MNTKHAGHEEEERRKQKSSNKKIATKARKLEAKVSKKNVTVIEAERLVAAIALEQGFPSFFVPSCLRGVLSFPGFSRGN